MDEELLLHLERRLHGLVRLASRRRSVAHHQIHKISSTNKTAREGRTLPCGWKATTHETLSQGCHQYIFVLSSI